MDIISPHSTGLCPLPEPLPQNMGKNWMERRESQDEKDENRVMRGEKILKMEKKSKRTTTLRWQKRDNLRREKSQNGRNGENREEE